KGRHSGNTVESWAADDRAEWGPAPPVGPTRTRHRIRADVGEARIRVATIPWRDSISRRAVALRMTRVEHQRGCRGARTASPHARARSVHGQPDPRHA